VTFQTVPVPVVYPTPDLPFFVLTSLGIEGRSGNAGMMGFCSLTSSFSFSASFQGFSPVITISLSMILVTKPLSEAFNLILASFDQEKICFKTL